MANISINQLISSGIDIIAAKTNPLANIHKIRRGLRPSLRDANGTARSAGNSINAAKKKFRLYFSAISIRMIPETNPNESTKEWISEIGSFGLWQKKTLAFVSAVNFIGMFHSFAITFLAPNIDYRCIASNMTDSNWTDIEVLNSTDRCNIVYARWQEDGNTTEYTVPCTAWEYDTSEYTQTIISEWNLVCDREWMISFAKSVYMVGFLVSVLVVGQFSDYFGRFWASSICLAITTLACILTCFSTSYLMFVVLRFFIAFGRTGISLVGYVLLMEITGPEKRAIVGTFYQTGWATGVIAYPLVAWFIRPMYQQLWAMTIPLLILFCFIRIIPESPRWLRTQNKKDQLLKLLVSAAKQNGKKLDESVITSMISTMHFKNKDEPSKKTFVDLIKHPILGRRTLYMAVIWLIMGFVFYAVAYNTNDLGYDPYVTFFIMAVFNAASLPAYHLGAQFIGRKPTLIIALIATGATFIITMFLPHEALWITSFSVLGQFFTAAAFKDGYLFTSELFPTVVRNVALGTCSSSARLGSIFAPFVKELGQATHDTVPYALIAVLAIVAGLLGFLLPETRGREIDDLLH